MLYIILSLKTKVIHLIQMHYIAVSNTKYFFLRTQKEGNYYSWTIKLFAVYLTQDTITTHKRSLQQTFI